MRRLLSPALPLEVADLTVALADHAEHPLGICCHPDPTLAEPERSASAASLIMDLEARCMWLADGNPCTAPFRRLDYGQLLGTADAGEEMVP